MLTVEHAFDIAISEEGQFLMGEDFITETLGFSWKRIYDIFKKCVAEYNRRKPVTETSVLSGSVANDSGIYYMPEGTLQVLAVRYDILTNYPRFMFSDFGQVQFEYERHNRLLRTFPPMQTLRVTYSREYTFDNSAPITQSEYTVSYENEIELNLIAHPKKGTLTVSKNGKTMKESGITYQEVMNNKGVHEKIKMIALKGDLGKGFYNPDTRELTLFIKKGEDGDVEVTFTPKYSYIKELSDVDTIFLDLFKSRILEALASLRSQATQAHLHNIDLTPDDLYGRARALRALVEQKLKDSFDYGSTAFI